MGTDIARYKMTYDLHTHTIYSKGRFKPHAVGTIEQNVEAARKLGLKAIAITDHGPGHLYYGVKRSDFVRIKEEIDRLNEVYSDIDIYFSCEANIVESGSGIDVTREEAEAFDFLIGGYHFGVTNGHVLGNWLHEKAGLGGSSLMRKNTDMVVRALHENNLKILTHPGDKAPVDMRKIAKACEETDTLMEINTFHKHLTAEEIEICMDYGVKFIISSDAHKPERVGSYMPGLQRAFSAGLDPARIVNIEEMK